MVVTSPHRGSVSSHCATKQEEAFVFPGHHLQVAVEQLEKKKEEEEEEAS